jgi:hypothetical protein
MLKRVTVLAAMLVFAVFANAQAQGNPIEIGTDAGFTYSITSEFAGAEQPDLMSFSLPFTYWRVGFFLNDTWSIEPALGFNYLSVSDDGPSLYTFDVTANVLYNLASGFFVHGGGKLMYIGANEGGGADTETAMQFGFGGGAGYRIMMTDMLKLRLGANVFYLLENEDDGMPGSIDIAATIGLSMFTK